LYVTFSNLLKLLIYRSKILLTLYICIFFL